MAELAVALLALFAHIERIFIRERAAHARAALAANQSVKQVAAFGVSHTTLYATSANTTTSSPLTRTKPLIVRLVPASCPTPLHGPDDNGGFPLIATGHPRAQPDAGEDVDGYLGHQRGTRTTPTNLRTPLPARSR